jgi:6-phosphogluconolactonase
VAESVADIAASSVSAGGWFSLAVSGGETPRALFRILREYDKRLSWPRVEIFWVDERYVPHRDPRSNYGVAKDVWLASSPLPRENIHPMPTDLESPEAAAQQYEKLLRAHFLHAWPRFDLVLLGLGPDCHTASLFPSSQALSERSRWVVPVDAPVEPAQRLTLTLPVINHAAHVHFLAAGSEKAAALKRALSGEADALACPASGVSPTDGELVWWIDRAAAEGLR